ncbi:MAG: hypothetical protein NTW32_11900 [Chloroflexi bacterium]|nr:hypothetical protein [Chloroflexota bacterium]
MISICAVIAVRNEQKYLEILLPILANQNIDVVIIDNDSNDDSQILFDEFAGKPIIAVEHLPYHGYFSLVEQLEIKQRVYNTISHDWVIHHDADEILESCKPGFSLREAIQEASDHKYDVINFDEFVFLPEPGFNSGNYYSNMLQYYFFEPQKNRLNRAWRRNKFLNNLQSGGHQLFSDQEIAIFPVNHILRHYIVLSYQHALNKYLDRTFDPKEIAKGWHSNRLNFNENNLRIPSESEFIFHLDSFDSKNFCRNNPTNKHFWDWGK